MLDSQLESPREQLPKRRKMSQTLRSTQASVTQEDEAEVMEEEESEAQTPPWKVTGKNLAALKRQTAADTGKNVSESATRHEAGTKSVMVILPILFWTDLHDTMRLHLPMDKIGN